MNRRPTTHRDLPAMYRRLDLEAAILLVVWTLLTGAIGAMIALYFAGVLG